MIHLHSSAATGSQQRPTVSTAAIITAQPAPTIQIKKLQFHKNGLPIKSAMKSPVTSPVTVSRPLSIRSHSSPTPFASPRFVHFNTQLEHVRLFLQGEMPSCVAERVTIIDSRQDERSNCDIKLTLPNWTPAVVESFKPVHIDSGNAPLRVENVVLSEDQQTLEGQILVQNIAFHKRVSVRYTVDFWQTQSEVSAEYEESIAGTTLDRFSFEIPLDMERAMVEKSFCFAVRYQVIGREFWDSNNGKNYQIECKRVVVVASPTPSDLSKKMTSLLIGATVPEYSKPVLKKKLANRYDLSTSLSAAYSSQPIAIPNPIPPNKKMMEGSFFAMSGPVQQSRPASQSAYRPSEYISPSPSPQNYHHTLYASSPKFLNSYLAAAASPPDHFHLGYDALTTMDQRMNSKRGTTGNWNVDVETTAPAPAMSSRSQSFPSGIYGSSGMPSYSISPKSSSPISIPTQRARPVSAPPSASPSHSRQQSPHRPAVGSSSYFDLVDRYCFYESSPHGSPYTSPYSSYPNSPPAPCIKG
ncbi:hypothetical protein BGZ83_002552 [Gryganskiella cystojenkinii]|nr:hypothetical protein BGZ83_002552 [Gryganskiella cystojenkinii]